MHLRKGVRRVMAVFLLINLLQSIVAPTVVWALTNGPAAPEFSSFEPIDANGMVNLSSGDLAYSLPLMMVPGPEGGYPVNLSYHAGIQMEQEASWVGLGWNLNAGAINRFTMGIADDVKGAKTYNATYDNGTNAYEANISLSVGVNGVSAGIGVDWNSYKSVGFTATGGFTGSGGGAIGGSIGTHGVGLSAGYGYQGAVLGAGLGANISTTWGGALSGGVGMSAGVKSASGGGVNLLSLGVSFSSQGTSAGVGILGGSISLVSPQDNTGAGTHVYLKNSVGLQASVPFTVGGAMVTVGLGFAYNQYRIYYSRGEVNSVYGGLYAGEAYNDYTGWGEQMDNQYMDRYSDPFNPSTCFNLNESETNNTLSGLAYDKYLVEAQGLSGSMTPRNTQSGVLVGQNFMNTYYSANSPETEVKYNFLSGTGAREINSSNVYFSFDCDPSGYYLNEPGSYAWTNTTDPLYGSTYTGTSQTTGRPGDGASFYNSTKHRNGSGNYIDFFYNSYIANPSNASDLAARGFIDYDDLPGAGSAGSRSDATAFETDGIGAFVITTADGKQYHYSLPVYQNESMEMYLKRDNPSTSNYYSTKLNNYRYAYAWLLTSITGPDYVDKNGNGKVDLGDYGYWVKFDYGKWADGYVWRNPYNTAEYTPGLDPTYESFTTGSKQIYYLDKIITATHTAYFIKDLRSDATSANNIFGFFPTQNSYGGSINTEIDLFNDLLSGDKIHSCPGENNHPQEVDGSALVSNPQLRLLASSISPTQLTFTSYDNAPSSSTVTHNHIITNGNKYSSGMMYFNYELAADPLAVRQLELAKIVLLKNGVSGDACIGKTACIPGTDYCSYITNHNSCDIASSQGCSGGKGCLYAIDRHITYQDENSETFCVLGAPNRQDVSIGLDDPGVTNTCMSCSTVANGKIYLNEFQAQVIDVQDYKNYINYPNNSPNPATVSNIVQAVDFTYSYDLCAGTPNSSASGKLTLKSVQLKGAGDSKIVPSYDFDYYNFNSYNEYQVDYWGFETDNVYTNGNLYPYRDADPKSHSQDWSLKTITTPLNSVIQMDYESDTYCNEAALNSLQMDINNVYTATFQADPNIANRFDFSFTLPSTYINLFNITSNTANYDLDSIIINQPPPGNPLPLPQFSYTVTSVNASSSPNAIKGYIDVPNNSDVLVVDDLLGNVPTTNPLSGKITVKNLPYLNGGGIRVKDIKTIDNFSNQTLTTSYNYNNPITGQTSGITTYAASNALRYIPYVFEIPPPNVIYEYVTVNQVSQNGNTNGSNQYHFKVYTPTDDVNAAAYRMGNDFWIEDKETGYQNTYWLGATNGYIDCNEGCNTRDDNVYGRVSVIHNNMSAIGSILDVTLFDNNYNELSSTSYNYYSGDNAPQGSYQESAEELKRYIYWDASHQNPFSNWLFTATSKIFNPVFLQSTSTTSEGITTTTSSTDFDIQTGAALQAISTTADGKYVRTTTRPANLDFSGMGSKLYDNTNANMLTQQDYSLSELSYDGTTWEPLSASATTWNNSWSYRELDGTNSYYAYTNPSNEVGVWRMAQSWAWKGGINEDGSLSNFSNFSFGSGATNVANWNKASEVTLYDHYSNALEARDIDLHYAATKLGYNGNLVLATASNANYNSFAASSFEDPIGTNMPWVGGEVSIGSSANLATVTAANAHTGASVLLCPSGTVTVFSSPVASTNALQGGRTYSASVWVNGRPGRSGSPAINAQVTLGNGSVQTSVCNLVPGVNHDGWQLLNTVFTVPSTASNLSIVISDPAMVSWFDDFRFQPVDASVTSYVYDPLTSQVTYILDQNNFYTHYLYDAAGRLTDVYKETGKGVKKIKSCAYNYAKTIQ